MYQEYNNANADGEIRNDADQISPQVCIVQLYFISVVPFDFKLYAGIIVIYPVIGLFFFALCGVLVKREQDGRLNIIELGRCYQVFSDIKQRKSISRTLFIDRMSAALLGHMEEDEGISNSNRHDLPAAYLMPILIVSSLAKNYSCDTRTYRYGDAPINGSSRAR